MRRTTANPRPVLPRRYFHESSGLRSERDSDMGARQWLKNRTMAGQQAAVLQNVQQVQRQLDTLRIFKGDSTAKGAGWKWAKVKEYDSDTRYKKNQVVVVSPDNAAVTAGIATGDPLAGGAVFGLDGWGMGGDTDRALPGVWVCVQAPRIVSETLPDPGGADNWDVHLPNWPPPNDNPDSVSNYWWLIGFYPAELNVCVDGANVPYFVQAQPVDEDQRETLYTP